tara:strand:- start:411 stop:602 length:192 start_codon:yes stop_codon:yes gene_type:complete
MKYNKDMTIAQIIFTNPKNLEVLKKYGLRCQTCFGAQTETLEVAARVNGIKLENILRDFEMVE